MKTWRTPLDPSGEKDYEFDWTTKLNAEGDTISGTPVVTLPQDAIDAGLEAFDQTNGTLIVSTWFRVNAANQGDAKFNGSGVQFAIKCEIVTAGGRTFPESGILTVCNR